jgi:hypothetical protein
MEKIKSQKPWESGTRHAFLGKKYDGINGTRSRRPDLLDASTTVIRPHQSHLPPNHPLATVKHSTFSKSIKYWGHHSGYTIYYEISYINKYYFTISAFHVVGSETWIDVSHNSEISTQTHWVSESGILDLFILPGPTPDEIFVQYARLTGTPSSQPSSPWVITSADGTISALTMFGLYGRALA